MHQQLVTISSGNYSGNGVKADNMASPNKLQTNSVYIHRHINNAKNNNVNHFEQSPPAKSSNDSFYNRTSFFKDQNAEEYAAISKELKSLNLRQHERIYSAGKLLLVSFELISLKF